MAMASSSEPHSGLMTVAAALKEWICPLFRNYLDQNLAFEPCRMPIPVIRILSGLISISSRHPKWTDLAAALSPPLKLNYSISENSAAASSLLSVPHPPDLQLVVLPISSPSDKLQSSETPPFHSIISQREPLEKSHPSVSVLSRSLSSTVAQYASAEGERDAELVQGNENDSISAYLADLCGDSKEGIDGQCVLSSLKSSFHKPQLACQQRSGVPVQNTLEMIDLIYDADILSHTSDVLDQIEHQNLPIPLENSKMPHSLPLIAALRLPRSAISTDMEHVLLVFPRPVHSLATTFRHCSNWIQDENRRKLIAFQIFTHLHTLHSQGIVHNSLSAENIFVDETGWILTAMPLLHHSIEPEVASWEWQPWESTTGTIFPEAELSHQTPECIRCDTASEQCQRTYMERWDEQAMEENLSGPLQSCLFQEILAKWQSGEISNLEYLLWLNRFAGRIWGDRSFHPVVPWVIDMLSKPEPENVINGQRPNGFRDLTKTKWRLTKGDEQLDFTYQHADIPHHISDELLSELTVCIYTARRLPLDLLRNVVRANYEPREYPSRMSRMYEWTPDECIPEFYVDPTVFESVHQEMSDLQIPGWAQSPAEFIQIHRYALEGAYVSSQLHHWIDLIFGYQLTGQAAVDAKNVYLPATGTCGSKRLLSRGRVQLFHKPHPSRFIIHPVQHKSELSMAFVTEGRLISEEKSANRTRLYGNEPISLKEVENAEYFTERIDRIEQSHRFLQLEKRWEGLVGACRPLSYNCQKSVLTQDDLFRSLAFKDLQTAVYILGSLYIEEPVSLDIHGRLLEAQAKRMPAGVKQLVRSCLEGVCENEDSCAYGQPGTNQQKHSSDKNGYKHRQRISLSADDILRSDLFSSDIRDAYHFLKDLRTKAPGTSQLQWLGIRSARLRTLGRNVMVLIAPACMAFLRDIAVIIAKGTRKSEKRRSMLSPSIVSPPTLKIRTPGNDDEDEWKEISKAALDMISIFSEKLPEDIIEEEIVEPLIRIWEHSGQAFWVSQEAIADSSTPITEDEMEFRGAAAVISALLDPYSIKTIANWLSKALLVERIIPSLIKLIRLLPSKKPARALAAATLSLPFPLQLNYVITPLVNVLGRNESGSSRYQDAVSCALCELSRTIPTSLVSAHITKPILVNLRQTPSSSITNRERLFNMLDQLFPASQTIDQRLYSESIAEDTFLLPWWRTPPSASDGTFERLSRIAYQICFSCLQNDIWPPILKYIRVPLDSIQANMDRIQTLNTLSTEERTWLVSLCSFVIELQPLLLSEFHMVIHPDFRGILMDINRVLGNKHLDGQKKLAEYAGATVDATGTPLPSRGVSINRRRIVQVKSPKDSNRNSGKLAPDSLRASSSLAQFLESETSNDSTTSQQELDGPWSWLKEKKRADQSPRIGSSDVISSNGHSSNSQLPDNGSGDWVFRSTVIHQMLTHSISLRGFAMDELDTDVQVVSAGVSSRNGSGGARTVLRSWALGESNCVVEYSSHRDVINDAIRLENGLVASCGSDLHLWSANTGETLRKILDYSTMDKTMTDDASNGVLTCLTGEKSKLFAGSSNALIHYLDPETLRCIAVWRLAPYRHDPSFTSTIFRMDTNSLGMAAIDSWPPVHCIRRPRAGSNLFAAFGAGYLAILDERVGSIVSCWKGHKELVSSLLLHPEKYPETMLITASHDRFLSLWDTRMIDDATSWTAAVAQSRLVGSLKLSGAISCMDQYQDNVFCAASGRLTLVNLQTISKSHTFTADTASSGASDGNRDVSGGVSQLSYRGVASLGIMKHSKLLLVGQEDGVLKIIK